MINYGNGISLGYYNYLTPWNKSVQGLGYSTGAAAPLDMTLPPNYGPDGPQNLYEWEGADQVNQERRAQEKQGDLTTQLGERLKHNLFKPEKHINAWTATSLVGGLAAAGLVGLVVASPVLLLRLLFRR
jgi:hypothetical protein